MGNAIPRRRSRRSRPPSMSPSSKRPPGRRSSRTGWTSRPRRRGPPRRRDVRERTFCLVKPDGVQRGLVGEIVRRFEQRGLQLVALKMVRISHELAEEYYAEHRGKAFFAGLVEYVTSGPAVATLWEGENSVAVVRKMMGATDPAKAEPGTIRADFGLK